jgi:hypothetical protein
MERVMTTVYCTAYGCKYNKPHDEDYGICDKDHITLDENVALIFKGCPDSDYERVSYCDINKNCEDCKRYGDDCDGDPDRNSSETL